MGGRNGRARIEWLRSKRRATLDNPYGEEAILYSPFERWFEIGIIDHSKSEKSKFAPSLNGVMKKIDLIHKARRTIFVKAKDQERAKRKGEAFGEVEFCRKVDTSYYLNKIEHLDLKQEPQIIPIIVEPEYTLNADMELSKSPEEKLEIPIDRG